MFSFTHTVRDQAIVSCLQLFATELRTHETKALFPSGIVNRARNARARAKIAYCEETLHASGECRARSYILAGLSLGVVTFFTLFFLIIFCGTTHQMISHSLVSGKYHIQSSSQGML